MNQETEKQQTTAGSVATERPVEQQEAGKPDTQNQEAGKPDAQQEVEKSDTQQQKTEMSAREKKKQIIKEALSWVRTIVLAFVIALLLNRFIIVNANVPTGSMENTIQPGDRLIGFRLSYINSSPQRGDIIIFTYPVDEDETYIKRVIGLPGETVEIRDAKVYIDGSSEPLDEDYLKEEWVTVCDGMTFHVPEGYYFVMGDNRNDSLDGRYWADEAVKYGLADTIEEAVEEKYCFVSKDAILGKAIFRYYPSVTKLTK